MANRLSVARVAAAPLMVLLAASGLGRLCAIVLVIAGISDVLDGFVARRSDNATAVGARLDGAADAALLVATGGSLFILHPDISQAAGWLLVSAALVAAAWAASQRVYGRMVPPGQPSSKVAGAMLYGFALLTLWTGSYEPLLMEAATTALAISSLETLVRATRRHWNDVTVIQASGSASRHLSHRPHASNDVAISAGAGTSSANSPAATARPKRRR